MFVESETPVFIMGQNLTDHEECRHRLLQSPRPKNIIANQLQARGFISTVRHSTEAAALASEQQESRIGFANRKSQIANSTTWIEPAT